MKESYLQCKGINFRNYRKFIRKACAKKGEPLLQDVSQSITHMPIKDIPNWGLYYSPQLYGKNIDFDKDLARLIGYFLAEGSFGGHVREDIQNDLLYIDGKGQHKCTGVAMITINQAEVGTIGKDVQEIIKQHFPKAKVVVKNIYFKDENRSCTYSVLKLFGEDLLKFLLKYCKNKKMLTMHKDLLNINKEAMLNLLCGFIAGDGYIVKNGNGRIDIAISNKILAEQIHTICNHLKIKNTIHQYDSFCQNKDFKGIRYMLNLFSDDNSYPIIEFLRTIDKTNCNVKIDRQYQNLWHLFKNGFFRRVIKSEAPKHKAIVYNIEVNLDHSYIVNGVAVQNCKHSSLVFDQMPFYNQTMAKHIKKYYKKAIDKAKGKYIKAQFPDVAEEGSDTGDEINDSIMARRAFGEALREDLSSGTYLCECVRRAHLRRLNEAIEVQKVLSETDEGNYIRRKELWDDMDGGDLEMDSCYAKDGSYIGNYDDAKVIVDKYGIKPERSRADHDVASIGYSEKSKSWYGWSHRAIHGFKVGDKIKKGDCAYKPDNIETFVEDLISFWGDEGKEVNKIDYDVIDPNGYASGLGVAIYWVPITDKKDYVYSPVSWEPYPEKWGRGEYMIQTEAEARQAAIDFAEGVA